MDTRMSCQAWQTMYQQRHCPSLGVLQGGSAEAGRHLASCSNCRARLESAASATRLGALLKKLPLPEPKASLPVPGDVRALRPKSSPGTPSGAWVDADGVFYNPPFLLVLTRPDSLDLVQVAQLFDQPGLQADGDIPLPLGLVAEAWNTYAVPAADLDAVPYTHAGAQYAEAVLRRAGEPFADIEENSALFSFRQDECRTGSFFSLRLNLPALDSWEDRDAEEDRLHDQQDLQDQQNPNDQETRTLQDEQDKQERMREQFRKRTAPFALLFRRGKQESRQQIRPGAREILVQKMHLASLLLGPRTSPSLRTQQPSALLTGAANLGAMFKIPAAAFAAAGIGALLGRGEKTRTYQHSVLVCLPDGQTVDLPAEVDIAGGSDRTAFGITCRLPANLTDMDRLSAVVGAIYGEQDGDQDGEQGSDRDALRTTASWKEDGVLLIDAVFAGRLTDVAPLRVAIRFFMAEQNG